VDPLVVPNGSPLPEPDQYDKDTSLSEEEEEEQNNSSSRDDDDDEEGE
jgi:hypothetical protein